MLSNRRIGMKTRTESKNFPDGDSTKQRFFSNLEEAATPLKWKYNKRRHRGQAKEAAERWTSPDDVPEHSIQRQPQVEATIPIDIDIARLSPVVQPAVPAQLSSAQVPDAYEAASSATEITQSATLLPNKWICGFLGLCLTFLIVKIAAVAGMMRLEKMLGMLESFAWDNLQYKQGRMGQTVRVIGSSCGREGLPGLMWCCTMTSCVTKQGV